MFILLTPLLKQLGNGVNKAVANIPAAQANLFRCRGEGDGSKVEDKKKSLAKTGVSAVQQSDTLVVSFSLGKTFLMTLSAVRQRRKN
jgi:hypothetical protein